MTGGMTTRLPAADFGGPNRYPPPGLTGRPAQDYGSEGKRSCNAGLAPDPRVWFRSPRFFTPYRPTRTRQDLPCTNAGEPAPPDGGFDVTGRRAISGPLTPANRGLSRSLTDGLVRRSSRVETRMAQIPKLTVRTWSPEWPTDCQSPHRSSDRSTDPVPNRSDDVACTAAIAPPHRLAVVFDGVTPKVVFRAHRPHGHVRAHDRILHIVGDGEERAYPVISVPGRDAARVAEGAAEISKDIPQVSVAMVHESQADRSGQTGRAHVRLDCLQRVLKLGKQPRLCIKIGLKLGLLQHLPRQVGQQHRVRSSHTLLGQLAHGRTGRPPIHQYAGKVECRLGLKATIT